MCDQDTDTGREGFDEEKSTDSTRVCSYTDTPHERAWFSSMRSNSDLTYSKSSLARSKILVFTTYHIPCIILAAQGDEVCV